MSKKIKWLCAALILGSTSANASTVMAPTDGDVNFLDISEPNVPWSWELYMFDDSTVVSNSLDVNAGLYISLPSIVGISGPFSGNYIATSTYSDTLTLSDSDQFILAIYNINTGDWIEDSGVIALGANAYRISFEYNNANDNRAILAVDVATTTVPLPTAFWLFASGIAGILAIKRKC